MDMWKSCKWINLIYSGSNHRKVAISVVRSSYPEWGIPELPKAINGTRAELGFGRTKNTIIRTLHLMGFGLTLFLQLKCFKIPDLVLISSIIDWVAIIILGFLNHISFSQLGPLPWQLTSKPFGQACQWACAEQQEMAQQFTFRCGCCWTPEKGPWSWPPTSVLVTRVTWTNGFTLLYFPFFHLQNMGYL